MRLLAFLFFALLPCSSVYGGVARSPQGWIEPAEAIRVAKGDPSYGVRGKFLLDIRAIGHAGGRTFLNSEAAYRDPACLTVSMSDVVAGRVATRLGVRLEQLQGRRIVVSGVARRVPIVFRDDSSRHKRGYYQTHVLVDSATQVEFAI